jgi:Ca2+-binding EF-hand superfamily protein
MFMPIRFFRPPFLFLPPQKDPQAWFQVVDMDGDGDLNAREVFEVLKAQFPIDYNRLEQVY